MSTEPDQDEPHRLNGIRREVWWSRVIQALRERDPSFPFRSPLVLATNADQAAFADVAWVILEKVDGQPIVGWDPSESTHQLTDEELQSFNQLLEVVVASLYALEGVNEATLKSLGLPPLPAPPHGMRRYQRKGFDMSKAVLGNGAFEIKNFWRATDGSFVLMDNEFAGWYPKYDHLSYLYHRLYCNAMRPDLARLVLNRYRVCYVGQENEQQFLSDFSSILKPRLLGGWFLDTVRRKLPPWHRKQRLRYELLWNIFRKQYQ